MEEKQHLEMEGLRRSKSSYLSSVAILVLSLLLSACVATVIYMSIHPATIATCQTPNAINTEYEQRAPTEANYPNDNGEEEEYEQMKKDKANLDIRNENGDHMSEEVEYDESRDVAVFHGPNGYFEMEDFKKGIRVIKDTNRGDCYVIPVGTNMTAGRELRDYVKQYHGQEIQPGETKTYRAEVLPGAIDDTSFLQPEARKACANFHWLSIVGEETAEEDAGTELRRKRDTCSTYIWYLWHTPVANTYLFVRIRFDNYCSYRTTKHYYTFMNTPYPGRK